jgi:hypothetical protein
VIHRRLTRSRSSREQHQSSNLPNGHAETLSRRLLQRHALRSWALLGLSPVW